MQGTNVLFGQIAVVIGIVIAGVWGATQWTAATLGYQVRLGSPWFDLLGVPVYHPWRLFEWWFFFDAYPEQYAATISGDRMAQDARERWQNTLNGLHTAMRMQAQVSQNLAQDESALADLVSQSQSATGALQAMQATNQLLALQAKQSIQAQQLQITQDRAASLELARQAAAMERAREVRRRFLGTGTPYTPQSVNFYNN